VELARHNRAIETARVRSEAFSRAEMNALHSIVVELAEKAGISPEDFEADHTHRLRWFLD
jgi:hypothetical protein